MGARLNVSKAKWDRLTLAAGNGGKNMARINRSILRNHVNSANSSELGKPERERGEGAGRGGGGGGDGKGTEGGGYYRGVVRPSGTIGYYREGSNRSGFGALTWFGATLCR